MNWSRRYAIRSYLRSTVWTAPVIALVLEQITFRIAYFHGIDFGGIPGFVIGRSGTIALAGYVISSSIAFIVFTFSSLIVAGRERPTKPSNYRDHSAPRPWHSWVGCTVRLRAASSYRCENEDRYDPSVSFQHDWDIGTAQRHSIHVFDRSCRAPTASRQHSVAGCPTGAPSSR